MINMLIFFIVCISRSLLSYNVKSVASAHQQLLRLGLHHQWLNAIFVTEFL